MRLPSRHELRFGPYKPPRYRLGQPAQCAIRGDVTIVGTTAGRIPWPVGKTLRAKSLVIYGALEKALRKESSVAICHWWGVTAQTVTKWRKSLGVEPYNKGSRQLISLIATQPEHLAARLEGHAKVDRAATNAKISASKPGVPRSEETKAKLRLANKGKRPSFNARRRMSEAQRRRRAAER